MYKLFLFFSFSICLFACNSAPEGKAQLTQDGKIEALSFGEEINKSDAISYDEMIAKMAGTDSLNTKVMGTVEGVCQAKGCWINIVSDNPEQPSMFVNESLWKGMLLRKLHPWMNCGIMQKMKANLPQK